MKRFILIFLFLCCFLLVSSSVCFAEEGLVNDNYLLNNGDFISFDHWSVGDWASLSNGIFYISTSSSQKYPYISLNSTFHQNDVITLSIYVESLSGPSYLWVRSVSNTQLGNNSLSLGLNSCSFRLESDGVPEFSLSVPSSSSLSFSWVKAELGSSFTGYVPRSYHYYGFQDGISFLEQYQDGEVSSLYYDDFTSQYFIDSSFNGSTLNVSPYYTLGSSSSCSFSSSGAYLSGDLNRPSTLSFSTSQDELYFTYAVFVASINGSLYFSYGSSWNTTLVALKQGLNIFVLYVPRYSQTPPLYNTWTGNISFSGSGVIKKVKCELGKYFTGFPTFGSSEESSIASFNDGFSAGKVEGYQFGYEEGSSFGYSEGLLDGVSQGKQDGYNEGYQVGLQTAQNGSWPSLISAIVNVPVTAIISLLNFDILGFNMLNVFRTIILLSLFFFVLNLCLGKVKVS